MREALKPEVALEILSMCLAIAIEKYESIGRECINNLYGFK